MKTIIATIFSTLATIALVATFFLNSILGAFGLVSTSVETFRDLNTSKNIVQEMKTRHTTRKLKVTKKLAKRSSRRVASASLAAATIGTVAVAVTMVGFEVHDYCEDKKSLHDDFNVLYETTEAFNTEKCFLEAQDESKRILNDVKLAAKGTVLKAISSSTKYSNDKWLALKESTAEAFETSSASTSMLWDSTKSWLEQEL